MNETIKRLENQAYDYTVNLITEKLLSIGNYHQVFSNKFAELVAKESIIDFYRRYLDTTIDEDITVQVDRYIKDTFLE
jgi:hypothetical protein